MVGNYRQTLIVIPQLLNYFLKSASSDDYFNSFGCGIVDGNNYNKEFFALCEDVLSQYVENGLTASLPFLQAMFVLGEIMGCVSREITAISESQQNQKAKENKNEEETLGLLRAASVVVVLCATINVSDRRDVCRGLKDLGGDSGDSLTPVQIRQRSPSPSSIPVSSPISSPSSSQTQQTTERQSSPPTPVATLNSR